MVDWMRQVRQLPSLSLLPRLVAHSLLTNSPIVINLITITNLERQRLQPVAVVYYSINISLVKGLSNEAGQACLPAFSYLSAALVIFFVLWSFFHQLPTWWRVNSNLLIWLWFESTDFCQGLCQKLIESVSKINHHQQYFLKPIFVNVAAW